MKNTAMKLEFGAKFKNTLKIMRHLAQVLYLTNPNIPNEYLLYAHGCFTKCKI